jgi:hypothetical protein
MQTTLIIISKFFDGKLKNGYELKQIMRQNDEQFINI